MIATTDVWLPRFIVVVAVTGTPSNIINCSCHDIVLIFHIIARYILYVLFINYYFIDLRSRLSRQMLMLLVSIAYIARKFNPLVTLAALYSDDAEGLA